MELFYQAVRLGATRSILYIRMARTTSRDGGGGGGRHISEARASGRERQDEMKSHGTRHARQKRPGILREGSDEKDRTLREKRGGSGEEEEEAAARDTQRPVGIICTFCAAAEGWLFALLLLRRLNRTRSIRRLSHGIMNFPLPQSTHLQPGYNARLNVVSPLVFAG